MGRYMKNGQVFDIITGNPVNLAFDVEVVPSVLTLTYETNAVRLTAICSPSDNKST